MLADVGLGGLCRSHDLGDRGGAVEESFQNAKPHRLAQDSEARGHPVPGGLGKRMVRTRSHANHGRTIRP